MTTRQRSDSRLPSTRLMYGAAPYRQQELVVLPICSRSPSGKPHTEGSELAPVRRSATGTEEPGSRPTAGTRPVPSSPVLSRAGSRRQPGHAPARSSASAAASRRSGRTHLSPPAVPLLRLGGGRQRGASPGCGREHGEAPRAGGEAPPCGRRYDCVGEGGLRLVTERPAASEEGSGGGSRPQPPPPRPAPPSAPIPPPSMPAGRGPAAPRSQCLPGPATRGPPGQRAHSPVPCPPRRRKEREGDWLR